MVKSGFETDALRVKMLTGVLMRLSKQDLEKRLENAKAGLNPLGLGILKMISKGDCTISCLSQAMFIAPATIVPVIDSLEKGGFIIRKSDPADRRKNPLVLTEKGKGLLSKVPFVHKDDLLVRGLERAGRKKTSRLIAILCGLVDALSGDAEISKKILCSANGKKKVEK
ncbi:MAG: MarR family transcriptional regulator [Candidatus ainarchaeum sp.]|nr:MarR family transcriptional regulator [Candidatus ainarchaeum sp.]